MVAAVIWWILSIRPVGTEDSISHKTYRGAVQEVFVFPFNRGRNTGAQDDMKHVHGCQLGTGGDGI